MNTTHTVQGTIDNAMNITETISMLISKYKRVYGLTIVYKEDTEITNGEIINSYVTKKYYAFTLMYNETV